MIYYPIHMALEQALTKAGDILSHKALRGQLLISRDPIGFLLQHTIRMPRSIGVIADGNGRWATRHNVSVTEGHRAGAQRIIEVLRDCSRLPIETVVVWAMSPDNITLRDPDEIAGLMGLTVELLTQTIGEFNKRDARFIHLGNTDNLPENVVKVLHEAEALTAHNTGQVAALAFNYDGDTDALDGILRAVQTDRLRNDRSTTLVREEFRQYLAANQIGQLEMLIRTSGEQRLSKIGRIADRAELFFPKTLMPDFTPRHLAFALLEYSLDREIRGGGRPKKPIHQV